MRHAVFASLALALTATALAGCHDRGPKVAGSALQCTPAPTACGGTASAPDKIGPVGTPALGSNSDVHSVFQEARLHERAMAQRVEHGYHGLFAPHRRVVVDTRVVHGGGQRPAVEHYADASGGGHYGYVGSDVSGDDVYASGATSRGSHYSEGYAPAPAYPPSPRPMPPRYAPPGPPQPAYAPPAYDHGGYAQRGDGYARGSSEHRYVQGGGYVRGGATDSAYAHQGYAPHYAQGGYGYQQGGSYASSRSSVSSSSYSSQSYVSGSGGASTGGSSHQGRLIIRGAHGEGDSWTWRTAGHDQNGFLTWPGKSPD